MIKNNQRTWDWLILISSIALFLWYARYQLFYVLAIAYQFFVLILK